MGAGREGSAVAVDSDDDDDSADASGCNAVECGEVHDGPTDSGAVEAVAENGTALSAPHCPILANFGDGTMSVNRYSVRELCCLGDQRVR